MKHGKATKFNPFATRVGVHAKASASTALRWGVIAWLVLVIAAAVVTATVWPASASTSATPTATICGAFHTWDRHRTLGNANTMMTDVMRLPWVKYVSRDMTDVYGDFRGGAAEAKYLAGDVKYAREDCVA